MPRPGPVRRPATNCRRGAARTSRGWRWPRSGSPRRCAAGSSWWRRRRSAPARSTWSPPRASRWRTACPCCCWPATRSRAACPTPCSSRSSTSTSPSTTVNDAFRPVVRYWDRITRPEQVIQSLPQAIATLLDPADCGPAFIALPQDVQAEVFDFPDEFFEPQVRTVARPRPDTRPGRRGGRRAAGGGEAVDHRRRRRALLARRGRAGGVRRASRHPGRRDGRRQVDADARPPELRRPGRRRRVGGRQPARRRGRRGARRRDPSRRLRHRVVERVPEPGDAARRPSTPPGSTPASTSRCPSSATPARRSSSSTSHSAAGRRRRRGRRGSRPEVGLAVGVPRRRSARRTPDVADVRAGRRRRSATLAADDDYALTASGGFPGELNNGWRSRSVGYVRLRVRVLVHGLRDLRRRGARRWPARGRRRRDRRSSATART